MEEEGEGGGRWAGRPWTRTWPARRRKEEALDPAVPEVEQAGLALSRLGGALEGRGTGAGSGGWLAGGTERRRGEGLEAGGQRVGRGRRVGWKIIL